MGFTPDQHLAAAQALARIATVGHGATDSTRANALEQALHHLTSAEALAESTSDTPDPDAISIASVEAGVILSLIASITGQNAEDLPAVETGHDLVSNVSNLLLGSGDTIPPGSEVSVCIVAPAALDEVDRIAEIHGIDRDLVAAVAPLVNHFGAAGVARAARLYAGSEDQADGLPSYDSVEMIAAERHRQVVEEGWTPEQDAARAPGTLASMAGCYILAAMANHPEDTPCPSGWPVNSDEWKPSGYRPRNLVKAAALLAAEIDASTDRPLDLAPRPASDS